MKNEKHLEFLQNNISRMNQCSFKMKGWGVTIVSALIALYAATISDTNDGNKSFIFIAIAPTVLFWVLDSLYLAKERKFVKMYNIAIGVDKNTIGLQDYEIPMKKIKGFKYTILASMISPSELFLYGAMIIGLLLFGFLA